MKQNEYKKELTMNLKGSLAGTAVLVSLVIITAAILLNYSLPNSLYLPLLMLCCAVSGFVSGYTGTRKYRKKGLKNGLVSAAVPATVLIAAIAVAENSLTVFDIIPIALLICFGATGGIAAVNIKRSNKKKR